MDRFSLYERVSECIRVCGQVRGAQHEATLADAGVVSQCSICIGKALASGPSVALTAPLTADSLLPLTAPSHCSHSLLPLIALIAARPSHCSLSVHHLTALSLLPITTAPHNPPSFPAASAWRLPLVRPPHIACVLAVTCLVFPPCVSAVCVISSLVCVCTHARREGGCAWLQRWVCRCSDRLSLTHATHTNTRHTYTHRLRALSHLVCV